MLPKTKFDLIRENKTETKNVNFRGFSQCYPKGRVSGELMSES